MSDKKLGKMKCPLTVVKREKVGGKVIVTNVGPCATVSDVFDHPTLKRTVYMKCGAEHGIPDGIVLLNPAVWEKEYTK